MTVLPQLPDWISLSGSCGKTVNNHLLLMPISVLVWVRSFIEPDVLKNIPKQYHSDLSDQSALEIRVRI